MANVMTDELRRKFNAATTQVPRCVELAFEGVFEHSEYDLSFEDVETINAVLVACLDEMPHGDEAAKLAAAKSRDEVVTLRRALRGVEGAS